MSDPLPRAPAAAAGHRPVRSRSPFVPSVSSPTPGPVPGRNDTQAPPPCPRAAARFCVTGAFAPQYAARRFSLPLRAGNRMNLHEYQSKELFAEYGIPVPEGRPARSPEEAVEAAQSLGGSLWVVKAQVHAGGRGKAGGVQLARSLDDVRRHAQALLGGRLVTHQSGPEGLPVEVVYVEAGSEIDRELYLSLLVDRASGRIAFIASAAGGMDIEQVAAETPEKIVTVTISPAAGVQDFQVRRLASALKLGKEQGKPFAELVRRLYRLYTECDASLVEINPLIVTKAGTVVALDAKVNVEDNSLFRQKRLAALRDPSQEDPTEREAAEHGLNYVSLDGDIACMVNGAGLAMATMDLIKLHGGEPANFLDVGGGATSERVTAAFK